MRFASLGGSGNFAQAGIAAGREGEKTFRAVRENSPDFQSITEKQIDVKSKQNVAQTKADRYIAEANINANAKISVAKEDIKQDSIIKGSRRKAGVVAAMGKAGMGLADAFMGKPEKRDFSTLDAKIKSSRDKAAALRGEADAINTEFKPASTTPAKTTTTTTKTGGATTSAPGTTLSGARKELADAIAGPESGSWGYEAFNQGGAEGGTKVLGKSGSHKETYGTSLSDMTLGQIFHKQNTKQRGMSLDEHYKSGGLHAVGRYQFIGSTLQDEVAKMGLSHDTKFTPQVQDDIFFSHVKRVGNISPWVGPSVNYGQGKKNHLNSLINQV
tara:strand:+ start:280 stop:1266 length:987 start_codon:yes stop_codon:yes gene_type:complete